MREVLFLEELKGLAKEFRNRAVLWSPVSDNRHMMNAIALAIEDHVSRMVGRLQREADAEKRAEEDARESTLAPLPVYGSKPIAAE